MERIRIFGTACVVAAVLAAPYVFALDPAESPPPSSTASDANTQSGDVPGTSSNLNQVNPSPDSIDVEDFVDTASAQGIAEIETSKLALENGTDRVKSFAQQMIDDHRKANEQLAQLARNNNLEVSDEAGLMDKARGWILQVRDGESFDEAYAKNQVAAHQRTIELFQLAAQSEHGEISAFARDTLPKLEQHLSKARELAREVGGDDRS